VYGEQRPYNVAIIVPDVEYLEKWAGENGVDASDIDALLADDRVKELFKTEVNRGQSSIKHYERVRDFFLDGDEFTPENGMLTPSLKVKRRAVMAKFGGEIDAMYEGDDPLIGRNE
jgi:long-chain acyl-CoA synthetase